MDYLKTLLSTAQSNAKIGHRELEQIRRFTLDIPQKIAHFALPAEKLAKSHAQQAMLDAAINVSMERENFRQLQPEELLAYARKLEDKYAADISQYRFFTEHLATGGGASMPLIQKALFFTKNFDNQEAIVELLSSEVDIRLLETPLRELLQDIDTYSAQTENVAEKILLSWMVHFGILISLPAQSRYEMFARLGQKIYLETNGLSCAGHLFITPFVFKRQMLYKRITEQLRLKRWDDFMRSDLTSLLNFGIEVHLEAIEKANEQVKEIYHEQIEFEDLPSRQRNMANYFFEEGFKQEKPEVRNLNERQQKIMEWIYKERCVSTKDLSLNFRCNRKTIQRDFAELMDMHLVRALGNGAALRYTVNIRNREHELLEKYQNIMLSDMPMQISLFSGMPVEEKKPESINLRAF